VTSSTSKSKACQWNAGRCHKWLLHRGAAAAAAANESRVVPVLETPHTVLFCGSRGLGRIGDLDSRFCPLAPPLVTKVPVRRGKRFSCTYIR